MTGRTTMRASPMPPGWRYWRAPADGLIEVGTLRGAAAPLATHFHDEVQITLVLAGRRTMIVGGHRIEIAAGRCACIPAGVPHAGLSESADVVGLVLYVAAGDYAWDAMQAAIEALWRTAPRVLWTDVAAIVLAHRLAGSGGGPAPAPARRGRSREAFSRQFSRRTGMPPHAFDLVARLNCARRLLQAGEPIAAVAAETRFVDQSHFGRWFRRAFGVTPARYRRDQRTVTDVPDMPAAAGL